MSDDFAFCISSESLQMSYPASMRPGALEDLRKDVLDELGVTPSSVSLQSGCQGYGASMETVIAVVTGLLAVGPLVEQNIRAWERLGDRTHRAVRRLRQHGSVRVSEPVALSMVIHELSGRGISLTRARLLASHVIPVANYSLRPAAVGDFRAHPDRYYIFILRDDKEDTYLVTCRSSGAIEDLRRLPTGNYMEYGGIQNDLGEDTSSRS